MTHLLSTMTDLSERECLAIQAFPLEPTIGHLREPLGSAPKNPSATPLAINSPLEVDEPNLYLSHSPLTSILLT